MWRSPMWTRDMPQQDGPYGPRIPKPIPPVGNASEYVRRRPDGRVEPIHLLGISAKPGEAPADEWKKLHEAAHAARLRKLKAADLERRKVGEAFVEYVIGDPKVQACGRWLCLECPVFEQLFCEGCFPKPPQDGRGSAAIQGYEWPTTEIDAENLCGDIARVAKWHAYELPPTVQAAGVDSFFQTAQAIADAHNAFFDVLRGPDVIGVTPSEATGTPVTIEGDRWGRPERFLDVKHSDLLAIEAGLRRRIWTGINLHLAPEPTTVLPASVAGKRGGAVTASIAEARPLKRNPFAEAVDAALREIGLDAGQDNYTYKQIAAEIAPVVASKTGRRYESEGNIAALAKAVSRHYKKRAKF
jgi:hypothetical protein